MVIIVLFLKSECAHKHASERVKKNQSDTIHRHSPEYGLLYRFLCNGSGGGMVCGILGGYNLEDSEEIVIGKDCYP